MTMKISNISVGFFNYEHVKIDAAFVSPTQLASLTDLLLTVDSLASTILVSNSSDFFIA